MKKKDLNNILTLLENEFPVSFGVYKHGHLVKSIEGRMAENMIDTAGEYYQILCGSKKERRLLIENILNRTSRFFRNSYLFEILQHAIFPEILKRRKKVRIWSAGCSTGEEPWSLAIMLRELFDRDLHGRKAIVFASDIEKKNIESAATGLYNRDSLLEMKMGIIDKYFLSSRKKYTLHIENLPKVIFCQHDLTSSRIPFPPESVYGDFDLVLCRNVSIYLNDKGRETLVSNLYKSLSLKGYLVLGREEFLPKSFIDTFETIDSNCKIFRKRRK